VIALYEPGVTHEYMAKPVLRSRPGNAGHISVIAELSVSRRRDKLKPASQKRMATLGLAIRSGSASRRCASDPGYPGSWVTWIWNVTPGGGVNPNSCVVLKWPAVAGIPRSCG
jgi:hypothetical protein